MKKWFILITLLVVGALFVPAVSAETIIDEELIIYEDTGGTLKYNSGPAYNPNKNFNRIRLESVELRPSMPYIAVTVTADSVNAKNLHAEGEYDITYTTMEQTKPAKLYVEYSKNFLGTITHARYLIFFDDWDTTGYTGHKYITLSENLWTGASPDENSDTSSLACVVESTYSRRASAQFTITVASVNEWKNRLIVTDDILNSYQVNLQRVYGEVMYPSEITILKGDSTIFYEASPSDFITVYLQSDIDAIKIQSAGKVYQWSLESVETPTNSSVTVYIRNSQTGALISGANVIISAGFYEPAQMLEVSNGTLSGGTKTYTLQPTGGGLPNPDYYRVIVTADGYNAEMPYADITLDAGIPMTMVMGMHPTAGGPEDPNKTFIDVYVRDIHANPIADATVKMGTYTLQTNSAGYTVFDMPVNSAYSYTITKPGYIPVEGIVTVADAPRYPVNIVMGLGVIPTNTPTTGPVVTPTKPIGEETPGTGFMEESGQALASFFGVPLTIGKMILGMLLALAIGMTTAKHLKGGAQEFGIGLLGGAMLGVVIGLIPTWVIVVLLLTVGLYIGKMYMSGGAGGR